MVQFYSVRTKCVDERLMKETKLFWGPQGLLLSDRIRDRIRANRSNKLRLLIQMPHESRETVEFIQKRSQSNYTSKHEYVLVASGSDLSVPDEFFGEFAGKAPKQLPKLIHKWYSTNVAKNSGAWSDQLTLIPIGVDYGYRVCNTAHAFIAGFSFWTLLRPWTWFEFTTSANDQEALLLGIASHALPLQSRKRKVYSDWMFNANYGRSFPYVKNGKRLNTITRKDAYEKIKDTPIFEFPSYRLDRARAWTEKSMFAFELSLPGFGMDCFRIWEALALGIIVITVSSPLDPLFTGLPVVIIDDLDEITEANLDVWLEQYGPRFNDQKAMAKITNEYWVDRILESASN